MPSEVELARPVVEWLRADGWTVYQEVALSMYGGVADLVGVRGRIVQVVEVKRSCSLTLLDQAIRWTQHAHFVSIATPERRRGVGMAAQHVMHHFGLGWLSVHGGGYVQAYEHPTLHRHRALYTDRLLEACQAQPPDWGAEAGSSAGDHFTPWKQCCRALLTAARETPGITLKSILTDTRFHYQTQASARTSLSKWLREGKVRGVQVRLEGRNLCLYPAQEPAADDLPGGLG